MAAAKGTKKNVEGPPSGTPGVPQVLAIKVPNGRLVRIEADLPFDTLCNIAEEHDTTWYHLATTPLVVGSGKAAMSLYRACCEFAGCDVPQPLTARIVWEAVQQIDDDLPSTWVNGLPPTGDQTTD